MITPQRRQKILSVLEQQAMASIQELVDATGSSESTIRRDLIQMEQAGTVERFHGGALLPSGTSRDMPIQERSTKAAEEKSAIAKAAAGKVEKEACVFLDAGTTTAMVIDHLPEDIIVVTNSLVLIDKCIERGLQTFMIGGEIKEVTRAMIGPAAIEALKSYRFDYAFVGMNGIHHQHGFTTPDPEEAAIKREALELAAHRYVLADQSKFDRAAFARVTDLENAHIITAGSPHDPRWRKYQENTSVEVVKL